MKCIDCNRVAFIDRDLVCKESGEIIVCKDEPMELLRSRKCWIVTMSTGKVGGSYFVNGKLYCPHSKKECKEAGECYKNYCGLAKEGGKK